MCQLDALVDKVQETHSNPVAFVGLEGTELLWFQLGSPREGQGHQDDECTSAVLEQLHGNGRDHGCDEAIPSSKGEAESPSKEREALGWCGKTTDAGKPRR